MNDTWTITRTRIEEHVVPGKRLGRHYLHDSRSAFYEYPGDMLARTLADQLWARQIPILDQGNVGSCTGNAEVGLLGAAPFYAPLAAAGKVLNENTALALYSAAEVIDGDGPSPPTPDSSGLVAIAKSAQVRGGHEFVIRGVDIDRKLFHADNSWGTSWGVKGSFQFSWDTMATLLGQEGDCTIAVPLTQPAPTPTPPPTPAPAARPTAADRALAAAVTTWRKATGL
jgi:hypothetical protein